MASAHNTDIIKMLATMEGIWRSRGESFRARAYAKAKETVMLYGDPITYGGQIAELPGIGKTMVAKIDELINTGKVEAMEKHRRDPVILFSRVYGIGPKKAAELVKKHKLTTLDELREKQDELLNDVQRVGLRHFDDIEARIPRKEIETLRKRFETVFKRVKNPGSTFEIVGSYRRGAADSGDIDIIVSDPHNDTLVLDLFLSELEKKGYITHFLTRGKVKSLVVGKLKDTKRKTYRHRRIDFLFAPSDEYAAAVLYFTGSAGFNTAMRNVALKQGFSLNEHGLYHLGESGGRGAKKGEKVDVLFHSEADIFAFLGMAYREPSQRVDGRSIEMLARDPKTGAVKVKIPAKSVKKGKPRKVVPKVAAPKRKVVIKNAAGGPTTSGIVKKAPKAEDKTAAKAKTKTAKTKTRKAKTDKAKPAKKGTRKTKAMKPAKAPAVEKAENPVKAPPAKKAKMAALKKAAKAKKPSTKKAAKAPTKAQLRAHLKKFAASGISYVEPLPLETVEGMLRYANADYYNSKSGKVVLSDDMYDVLKEFVEREHPGAGVLREIGAPVAKGEKVRLPFFMGSMDKIKPDTGVLSKWKADYPHGNVLSVKLDGVSGLYTTEFATASHPDGATPKLYTRGDGTFGQDITHVLHYIDLPALPNVTVRGEFIVEKTAFERDLGGTFANPRNFVSGVINSKRGREHYFKYIHFVAYEVITPVLKPSEQFAFLERNGFRTARHQLVPQKKLTNDLLSELLVDWRANYAYEIDGVIVTDDHVYPRQDGNPPQSFAFKMVLSDQVAEAKVVDVLWEASKDGYLKPRVRIEPVRLVGVVIEYATAFNAKYVKDNSIGVGTRIRLVRSGDVIPHIQAVIAPAPAPKMPDVDYTWNATGVDAVLRDVGANHTVQKKRIAQFMKHLGVDNVGEGVVKKLMAAGFDSVEGIAHMSEADFLSVDGVQKRMAAKLHGNIQSRLRDAGLVEFMTASGVFGRGFGAKKFEALMMDYPDLFSSNDSRSVVADKIARVSGFSAKSAEAIAGKIGAFEAFMRAVGRGDMLSAKAAAAAPAPAVTRSHPLFGKRVVFTGFRDKDLEAKIKGFGGTVTGSVSSRVAHVVAKSESDTSSKANKGRELGILIAIDDFRAMYDL